MSCNARLKKNFCQEFGPFRVADERLWISTFPSSLLAFLLFSRFQAYCLAQGVSFLMFALPGILL
jgi:hypothetical protein